MSPQRGGEGGEGMEITKTECRTIYRKGGGWEGEEGVTLTVVHFHSFIIGPPLDDRLK